MQADTTGELTDRELLERVDRHVARTLAYTRTLTALAALDALEEIVMATQSDIDKLTAQLTQAETDFKAEWAEAIADIQAQASATGTTLDLTKLQAAADAFTADDSAWKTQLANLPAAPGTATGPGPSPSTPASA